MSGSDPKLPEPRPSLFSTRLYQPGRPLEEVLERYGLESAYKLASNENLFGISPRAQEALRASVEAINYYPDTNCVLLARDLAARVGFPEERLLLGNGTVEILYDLIRAYVGPGRSVVVGRPSFTAYPIATRLEGGEPIEVPLTGDQRLDLEAMADAIRADTSLVFVPNPNNPTGTMVTAEELDRFLDRVPEGVLVVMDEAYHGYMEGTPGYPDSLARMRAGRPLCAIRSLSKSLGIAGLRIGYGVFPAPVAQAVRQLQVPFHCSAPAQAAARAGLEDQEFLLRTRDLLAAARDHVYARLEELGLEYVPSHANFLMIRVEDAPALAESLMRRGFIVRPGEDLGAPGWLRVTVGPIPTMDLFLDALGEVLEEAGAPAPGGAQQAG